MIQVIERFHHIVEYLSAEPETPRTLSELAARIGVSAPACANIVKTMLHLGYVERAPGGRRGYILGAMPGFLARKGYKKYLVNTARPFLEQLVREVRELVVLVTESGGRRIELLKLESDSMVQVRQQSNDSSCGLFGTATGVVLLSWKTEAEFRELWESAGGRDGGLLRTADCETARRKCAAVAAAGYFLSEPQAQEGDDDINRSCTMAFPVFEEGRVVAAVGSRVPLFRFQGERREKILDACRRTAAEISAGVAAR